MGRKTNRVLKSDGEILDKINYDNRTLMDDILYICGQQIKHLRQSRFIKVT